jgi:hypothetical protein
MDATEFVLLHAGGCLIETPPMAQPKDRSQSVWRWAATLWRDTDEADGWRALVWDRAERGWWVPHAVMRGDVVEFGACALGHRGEVVHMSRWWGWIQRITPHGLVVVGPFDHPMRAVESARPTVDELRLMQLAPPCGVVGSSPAESLEF